MLQSWYYLQISQEILFVIDFSFYKSKHGARSMIFENSVLFHVLEA